MQVYRRLLLMLVLLVLAVCPFLEAKVLRGTVSSVQAWKERGQFVSKFCFHGKPSFPLQLITTRHSRSIQSMFMYTGYIVQTKRLCSNLPSMGHPVDSGTSSWMSRGAMPTENRTAPRNWQWPNLIVSQTLKSWCVNA